MLAPRDTLWSAHDEVIRGALGLLALTPSDVFADYGCGDGRVLISAASTVGCRCVGYEINPTRAAGVVDAVAAAGLSPLITIHAKNALEADFSEPTAVFLFLIKRGLRIILPYLNAAAAARPAGIRVVTALYKFPDHVVPSKVEVVAVSDDLKIPLYYYTLPVAAEAAVTVASAPPADEGEEGDE